jgi:hypothetical protein
MSARRATLLADEHNKSMAWLINNFFSVGVGEMRRKTAMLVGLPDRFHSRLSVWDSLNLNAILFFEREQESNSNHTEALWK